MNNHELNQLLGLPYLTRDLYWLGLRPLMDPKTLEVGRTQPVTWQSLGERLQVKPGLGIRDSGRPTSKQLRRAAEQLRKAGLIEWDKIDNHDKRRLVFRLPFAEKLSRGGYSDPSPGGGKVDPDPKPKRKPKKEKPMTRKKPSPFTSIGQASLDVIQRIPDPNRGEHAGRPKPHEHKGGAGYSGRLEGKQKGSTERNRPDYLPQNEVRARVRDSTRPKEYGGLSPIEHMEKDRLMGGIPRQGRENAKGKNNDKPRQVGDYMKESPPRGQIKVGSLRARARDLDQDLNIYKQDLDQDPLLEAQKGSPRAATSYQALMSEIGGYGWPLHKLYTPSVAKMVRSWVEKGVTVADVQAVAEIALYQKKGQLPATPCYLRPIMEGYLADNGPGRTLEQRSKGTQWCSLGSDNKTPEKRFQRPESLIGLPARQSKSAVRSRIRELRQAVAGG